MNIENLSIRELEVVRLIQLHKKGVLNLEECLKKLQEAFKGGPE